MDMDKNFIDSLRVEEHSLFPGIGEKLGLPADRISTVAGLLEEGCTVPFIARYRKEKTGSLDEVQVREIERLYRAAKNFEARRIEIIRGIFNQGKLSPSLYANIKGALSAAELEDIYAPYRRKKTTRAMLAQEKGLGPLAEALKEMETSALLERAQAFTGSPENGDAALTVEEALRGAMDIIAEELSQDPANRAAVKALYQKDGRIVVKASGEKGKGDEEAKKTSTYQMYWDFAESLSRVKAHRILAINRGEREGVLSVNLEVNEDAAVALLRGTYQIRNEYHGMAIEDGLKRLLSPAVIREIRGDQSDAADDHGISIFAANLKNLLMQRPSKGRVLGLDPGIRTGTKCVSLDDTGKYLGNFVIYHHRAEEAKRLLLQGIKQYDVQIIALGNGTGSREAQELVSQVIGENNLDVQYIMVDEDGASVYSASDIAREEFPELDLTIRGAISIGRRLQDPLAELVKIDPKSVGVGLYQHDLNQKKLSETLDAVVSSVVNNVGVNLNTASFSLLRYVSGINSGLARTIVQYRGEKGRIGRREELLNVSGMGPKSYEQCAGFLKIPESEDALDNTWIHPENYPLAREIRSVLSAADSPGPGLSPEALAELKEKYGVGDATITDIMGELKRPSRDPRDHHPKPLARKEVLRFEDLKEGMTVTGKIKNVVDFGAFVDLGIKETALVHISELSGRFVKDPLGLVKVGDVLEFKILSLDPERRRIGLSRKPEQKDPAVQGPRPPARPGNSRDGDRPAEGRRAPSPARNAGGGGRERRSPPPSAGPRPDSAARREAGAENRTAPFPGREHRPRPARPADRPFRSPAEDDGAMYNPFAEALRKMEERAARDKNRRKKTET
ncbi:MAG: helix-hairpin-helix domain-containing protein [Treponema sp.]|jgi:uncharacterized protein|nr:helix-hairpin-helix domain-containing protein [Treponema sp.]